MNTLLVAADVVLLLGLTLRLVRLVIADDLGQLLVQEPVDRWQQRIIDRWWDSLSRGQRYDFADLTDKERARQLPVGVRLLDAVACPWCIGFWLAGLALASLLVAWGVGGTLLVIWRVVAGAFTLNYVAAHLGSGLGDFEDPDEESAQ